MHSTPPRTERPLFRGAALATVLAIAQLFFATSTPAYRGGVFLAHSPETPTDLPTTRVLCYPHG